MAPFSNTTFIYIENTWEFKCGKWYLEVTSDAMKNVLHLNLHREFFAKIAAKTKRIEYRDQTQHWKARLENRKYDLILFRNGYAAKAPEMLVEFKGVRRYGKDRNAYYAIRLGRILKLRRWKG